MVLEEFVMLFMALAFVNPSEERDTITWKWIANGKYMITLAYECQFLGAMAAFPATILWKATAEPRSGFFAWLAMHD
jgi:hypothetical protein